MDEPAADPRPDRRWRLAVILLVTSALLAGPAVLAGWMNDDYMFQTALYETDAPFGYYDFMERFEEADLIPWYASPEYKLRFLRPLASLTLHLDFGVLGGAPLVGHLHSLAWSLLLLAGGFALLGRALPRREAGWAMVIFTFAVCHAWGAGWIAARNAVVAGALAMWAAACYLRWRQGAPTRHGVIAGVLYALALMGGEVALALPPFLLSYELAGNRDPWKKRLLALAPVAGITLVYLIAYRALGYGAAGAGAYVDPVSQPGAYLGGVAPKALAVLGSFGLGVPAMMRAIPGAAGITAVAGVLTALFLGGGYLLARRRIEPGRHRDVRWLGLAVLLPLLPGLAGLAQGREFVLSAVAFAGVAAVVLRALFAAPGGFARRVGPYALGGLLFFGTLVLPPLSRLGQSAFMQQMSTAMVTAGAGSDIHCQPAAPVFVVNGDLMRGVGFPFAVAHHRGITFPAWQQLATPESDIRIERTGPDTLVLVSDDKPLINDFLYLFREPDNLLEQGASFTRDTLSARVLEVSEAGPTRIEFTVPGLGDPASACWLRYDNEVLNDWVPPKVGQSEVITFVPPM